MSGVPRDVRAVIEDLAGPIRGEQWERLARYVEEFRRACGRLDLMSSGEIGHVWEHVADSAAVLSFVEVDGEHMADIGSGGGLPGMVVAVLRPRARVALIEARRRKSAFLRRVARRIGAGNVEVLEQRVEDLAGRRSFPIVMSRALGSVEKTLGPSLGVVAPGGCLVLFKGPAWVEEAGLAEEIARGAGAVLGRVAGVPVLGAGGRATTFVEFHVKRGE